jgi:hypothetical protein
VAPSIERLSKLINKTWLIYLFILSIICTNYLLLVSVRDWFKTKMKLLWFKFTFLNKNGLFDKIILSSMHCISFRPAKFYALCQAKMVIIFKKLSVENSIPISICFNAKEWDWLTTTLCIYISIVSNRGPGRSAA